MNPKLTILCLLLPLLTNSSSANPNCFLDGNIQTNIELEFASVNVNLVDLDMDGKFDSLNVDVQISADNEYSIIVFLGIWSNGDTYNVNHNINLETVNGETRIYQHTFDPVPFEGQFYIDVSLVYNRADYDFEQLGMYDLFPLIGEPKTQTSIYSRTSSPIDSETVTDLEVIIPFDLITIIIGMFVTGTIRKWGR